MGEAERVVLSELVDARPGALSIDGLEAMMTVEGSWWIALREFRRHKDKMGYIEAFECSKDPTTFTILFEDSAALAGLLIALAGITGSHLLHNPALDGIASIAIGLVLALSSLLLARESKALLLGESAEPRLRDAILRIAGEAPEVRSANGVLTVQMGPQQVMAALSVEFEDDLSTPDIEACIRRVEVGRTWEQRMASLADPETPGP